MTGSMLQRLRRFRRQCDGGTGLEFGFILPFLVLTILGIVEVSMILFATAMLEGGLREAARYGITGLDLNNSDREQHIVDIVNANGAGLIEVDSTHVSMQVYPDFASIGESEPYTDSNADGSYTTGEPFTDVNCNSQWDEDMGEPGLGLGNDVVIYEVNYDWKLMTGFLAPLIGSNGKIPLSASVAVRNEPFGLGATSSC